MLFSIRALLFVWIISLSLSYQLLIAADSEQIRSSIVDYATSYLDKGYKYNQLIQVKHPRSGELKTFMFDCSGFVSAVYWSADINDFQESASKPQMNTSSIYGVLKKSYKIYKLAPKKGDLIFFNKTTKRETPLSHIGIVIDTDKNGITTFVHMTNSGMKKGYINLAKSNDYMQGNVVCNSYVRGGVGTRGLASKCFNSYGSIFR